MKKHILFIFVLIGSLLINIISMQNGIFSITQHLYYLPILLGVFFYEKRGVYLAGLTSLLYLLTVLFLDHDNHILAPTIVRCAILISISILVYSLIKRNKEQEKELLQEHKWLETMLLSIGDGVIATDVNGTVRLVNKEAEMITGYEKTAAVGKKMSDVYKIYNKQNDEPIVFQKSDMFTHGGAFDLGDEIYTFTQAGVKKDLDVKASAISLSNQEILGFVIIFRDVTDKKKDEAEIIYLTYHDKLTGLYNRRFFEEELRRLDVERNLPVSVIIGDVNGLKLTNDAFGHLVGDTLLVTAANVMKEVCRDDDIIARWGGDEYIILLPRTDADEAERISERIRKRCSEEYVSNINLSISLGCGTKVAMHEDVMIAVKRADDLMYKRKLHESRSIKSRAVQSILNTLYEENDREAKHSIRVSELCGLIGRAMNLDKRQVEDLILLGKIHDIGKASIDQNILNKNGKLIPEEFEAAKQHSEKGYNIVGASPELSYLAANVLSHHERWDGTGYPNGLKGENIPLMARILTVADAFEAMTSDKAYRTAMSKDDAVKQLQQCSGTQFDPEIVKAFVQQL